MDKNPKLTFGELQVGDKFIVFPTPDEPDHKSACYILIKMPKMTKRDGSYINCVTPATGRLSGMPDTMFVIRVE